MYRVTDPRTGKIKGIKEVYGLGFETEEEAWNEYRLCTRGQDVDLFGSTTREYRTGYVTLYDQHMEQKGFKGPVNYYGSHPFHKGSEGKAIIRVVKAGLDFEMPDAEYPYVLNTGRVIEHWHSGTMTMRVRMLRELSPRAYVEVSPEDAESLKLTNGSKLKIISRRGDIVLPVWVTGRAKRSFFCHSGSP